MYVFPALLIIIEENKILKCMQKWDFYCDEHFVDIYINIDIQSKINLMSIPHWHYSPHLIIIYVLTLNKFCVKLGTIIINNEKIFYNFNKPNLKVRVLTVDISQAKK